MSLSDERKFDEYETQESPTFYYREDKVKQAVKELKEEVHKGRNNQSIPNWINELIEKIFGEKLIEVQVAPPYGKFLVDGKLIDTTKGKKLI